MWQKLYPHLLLNGLWLGLLIACYLLLPWAYEPLDNRLRDLLFQARGARSNQQPIIIVAIDEASLQALGQWPWERDKIARILRNLDAAGALLIGLDLLFAEEDKSSPDRIARAYRLPEAGLPNHDRILAEAIAETPVVLGHFFTLREEGLGEQRPIGELTLAEPADQAQRLLPLAWGAAVNLPLFQEQALSAGFLNYLPDEGGMVRAVPLLMRYRDRLYGGLSFQMYHLLLESPPLALDALEHGIHQLRLGPITVPTDWRGQLHLNFLGPGGAFPYLSAADVHGGRFDPARIKGQVVLVGATAAGLLDLRPTPFDAGSPGVEVHATALENLLSRNYLHRPNWALGADVAGMALIALLLALLYPFLPAYLILLVLGGGLMAIYSLSQWLLFQQGFITNILFPAATLVLTTTSSALANYYLEGRQKRLIRESFAKKVSPAVVEDILRHGGKELLIGRTRELSIFFSDVRDFTQITERLGAPERVIDLLNLYMTPMVEEVMGSAGTVDKLIGDAIMAYWNAPNEVPGHADQAVRTALGQLRRLEQVNRQLRERYGLDIEIGIGINTGLAIVGEMGSSGRSDYTIIGDAVNLASRLEGLCKQYGCRIIISEFTRDRLEGDYPLRELDLMRVKGKQAPVRIFQVLDPSARLADGELAAYAEALASYRQGQFQQAEQSFDQLLQRGPSPLYDLYRQRCRHYLANPPAEFDGIFVHTSK